MNDWLTGILAGGIKPEMETILLIIMSTIFAPVRNIRSRTRINWKLEYWSPTIDCRFSSLVLVPIIVRYKVGALGILGRSQFILYWGDVCCGFSFLLYFLEPAICKYGLWCSQAHPILCPAFQSLLERLLGTEAGGVTLLIVTVYTRFVIFATTII